MIKLLTPFAALALIAGLTGCDFHLRNKLNLPGNLPQSPNTNLNLPPNVPALLIQSSIKYSELEKFVRRGLHASGVIIVDDPTATGIAQLKILSERWGDLPTAIDIQGRAQEYSLRYAAIFTLIDGNGEVVVPQQVIELSRDYLSPQSMQQERPPNARFWLTNCASICPPQSYVVSTASSVHVLKRENY